MYIYTDIYMYYNIYYCIFMNMRPLAAFTLGFAQIFDELALSDVLSEQDTELATWRRTVIVTKWPFEVLQHFQCTYLLHMIHGKYFYRTFFQLWSFSKTTVKA